MQTELRQRRFDFSGEARDFLRHLLLPARPHRGLFADRMVEILVMQHRLLEDGNRARDGADFVVPITERNGDLGVAGGDRLR